MAFWKGITGGLIVEREKLYSPAQISSMWLRVRFHVQQASEAERRYHCFATLSAKSCCKRKQVTRSRI